MFLCRSYGIGVGGHFVATELEDKCVSSGEEGCRAQLDCRRRRGFASSKASEGGYRSRYSEGGSGGGINASVEYNTRSTNKSKQPEQHSQSRADDHAVGDYAATNPISLVDDNDGGGGDDDKVDYIYLANRIQRAIEQASQPRHPHALVSHNTFKLPITDSPSKPLTLLRNIPLATLLATTPIHEIYPLPIPIASPAFRAPSEQWWVGLSPAEMRAGPIRDETSVRDAEREVRNREKRRVKSLTAKNGMLKQQEEYAREGLKRQVLGLPMEGFVGLGAEREGRRKYGKEWERVLGELEGDVLEKDGEAEGEGELVEDEQGDNSDDGNYVER